MQKLDVFSDVLVSLPEIRDSRGALSVIERDENYAFERVFWIYDVPEGSERGGHAHRSCAELLFAVHGSFDVELCNGRERKTFHLDSPSTGLIIRPMVWCRLFNFSADFVGLCMASQKYLPEGYINDWQTFYESCNL